MTLTSGAQLGAPPAAMREDEDGPRGRGRGARETEA